MNTNAQDRATATTFPYADKLFAVLSGCAYGDAWGNNMNPIPVLAAYAALLADAGEPLYFPGRPGHQPPDSPHERLARGRGHRHP